MIRFIDITHYAGEKELYAGLNWHVKPGDRVGLVGDNGTGKTTLLRMAAGETEPTKGTIQLRKSARIGFLKQEIHAAMGDETVLQEAMKAYEREKAAETELHALYDALATTPEAEHEELYERIHLLEKHVHHHDFGSAESDARKILAGLGFALEQQDQPLSGFSGGWQMRAHIARLLLEEPDLLMLDEPTNHLDLESIGWLEQFLTSFAGALIVVSHDRYFLDTITTRTAWIHQRKLDTYATNYSGFLKERDESEELLLRRYQNQQEELAHHERFIERFRAKASKATSVQSRVKMVDKIERIELPESAKKVRLRIPEPAPAARHILELRDIGKAYGSNRVFTKVNLRFELGDKVSLVGRNGAGKSTLLKICAGVLDYEGTVEKHSKAQISYFSQHRVDEMNMENDVLTEARVPGVGMTDEQIRTLLGCFLFTGDDVYKPVRVLSGGEKSRLALARMMMRRGNILLLDEPTNHLDINTREVLQNALREFPGLIIMISHDRYFIDSVATRIVEVGGGTAINHPGNYTEFLAKKGSDEAAEANLRGRAKSEGSSRAPKPPPAFDPSGALAAIQMANRDRTETKRNQGDERRERAQKRNELNARIRTLQAQIEKHETRLAEIHALQADPDAFTKGILTPSILKEAKSLESMLPKAIKEWEELVEEAEQLSTATAR
ncbi:MAG: ABC-F family ATP-binding cassette domain-containing protein [Candidatus Sumerlaeaceae bacterium]